MDGLRVGLIGYGLAGAVFHAPLIAATPGLELAMVVTRDPARRAALHARHPSAQAVREVGELWAHADDLDLVVIATPNEAHVPLAQAAVDNGLPVVVDKPMAITAADGQRLVEAAAVRDVPLTVFHNRRYDGDFLTLRQLLADRALGEVHRFESRFERWRPVARPDAWREHLPSEAGGGLLLDLGSHLVDQALQLFGPPRCVYAEIDVRRPGVRGDDDVFVALEHRHGVRSHLWASTVAGQQGPRFRVLGSRAAFVIFGLDGQEAALRSGRLADDPLVGQPGSTGVLHGGDGDTGTTAPVPTRRGEYLRFYAEVAAALRREGQMPVTADEALMVLRVLEAARRSAGEGRIVPFE
jgi:scyllo-inositol 2-dehydrogenase (NADP+)